MELTEQQRMDLINAGWTPPAPIDSRREKLLNKYLMDGVYIDGDKLSPKTPGTTVVVYYGQGIGDCYASETQEFTAEEYNAALKRYKA